MDCGGTFLRKNWQPRKRSLGIHDWFGSGTTGGEASFIGPSPMPATGRWQSWSGERGEAGQGSFTLATQNVDGLHDRAGSERILKLHGDIWLVRCVKCDAVERNEEVPLRSLPPRCRCGGLLRPGVVWFGEALSPTEWQGAFQAAIAAQLMMVIGTSGIVYPAAGLAEVARESGAKLAVVNPEPTPLDRMAEWVVRGQAGEVLPKLL